MDTAEGLGLVAGAIGMIAFIPQALHVRKNNNTDGLSQATGFCFLVSLVLWKTYGVLEKSVSIVM